MKKIFLVICSLFMFNLALAADTSIADLKAEIAAMEAELAKYTTTEDVVSDADKANPMISDFAGTYLGLAPASESAAPIGEFEMQISEGKLNQRLATGQRISESSYNVVYKYMSPDELETIFGESNVNFEGKTVFSTGPNSGPPFFVFLDNPDLPALNILYDPDSMMGRMVMNAPLGGKAMLIFFRDSQTKFHEEIIATIEKNMGMVPLLSNEGKSKSKVVEGADSK